MSRLAQLMASLVIALIGVGCATPQPFKVAQDEFYGRIKTIVVSPIGIPEGLVKDPVPVAAQFILLIEAKLREGGFSVVPFSAYARVFRGMSDRLGGFVDPTTGKPDESKFKALQEHTLRELKTESNLDAVLYPRIEVVPAQQVGEYAEWDGTKEWLGRVAPPPLTGPISPGRGGGRGMLIRTFSMPPALSLVVVIQDTNGVEMYVNKGGIQLLARIVSQGALERPDPALVPQEERFARRDRNVAAVDIALGPLLRKEASKEP